MKDALIDILGAYEPVETIREIELIDGTMYQYSAVPDGLAGVDWPWIGSAILLIVVLFCLFKLLGGVLRD